LPSRRKVRRPQPARIEPEDQEILRQAKFDLMARYRQEFTETSILAAFRAEGACIPLRRMGEPPTGAAAKSSDP
jgi:hypothetical protein